MMPRLRWQRWLLMCVAVVYSSCHQFCSAQYVSTWMCNLESMPVEEIPFLQEQDDVDNDERHNLRILSPSKNDAIRRVVTGGGSEDRPSEDNIFASNNVTDVNNDTAYQEVRQCPCASGWHDKRNDVYYCPTPTNVCSVWRRRWGDENYSVHCFENKSWTVSFARNVWYYLCFALLLLVIYPFGTQSGRVSKGVSITLTLALYHFITHKWFVIIRKHSMLSGIFYRSASQT